MSDIDFEIEDEFAENPLNNLKFDLAQNILKDKPIPRLTNLVLIRISISLWQKWDVIDLMCTEHKLTSQQKLLKSQTKILAKASQLLIPRCHEETLKIFIKLVGQELQKFFTSKYHFYATFKNIDIYWNYICWTNQGTLNRLKTGTLLIEKSRLIKLEKYFLACNYCLVTHIKKYLKKLPENFICDLGEEKQFHLVLYWTGHMRSERKKFQLIRQKFTNEISDHKYLIDWSFSHGNEVATSYIRENFLKYYSNDKEYLISGICSSNVRLYFLSLLEKDIFFIDFRDHLVCLLETLQSDWRTKNLLLHTTKYFIKNFDEWLTEDNAYDFITFCSKANILIRDQYLMMVKKFLFSVNFIHKRLFNVFCTELLDSIISLEDVKTLECILNKVDYSIKRKYLFEGEGIKVIESLIMNENFDFFHTFMMQMFKDKYKTMEKFKKQIVHRTKICENLIVMDKCNVLDKIVEMFYGNEKFKFKSKLIYKYEYEMLSNILEMVYKSDNDQLSAADKFISWCFDGKQKKIDKCKSKIFDMEEDFFVLYIGIIYNLICKNKIDLAEKYLNWAFFTEIGSFTSERKFKVTKELLKMFILLSDFEAISWQSFKKFQKSFLTTNEVDEFKEYIKNTDMQKVFEKLIEVECFTEANNILDWRFASVEEKEKYKHKIYLNSYGTLIFKNDESESPPNKKLKFY